MKWLETWNQTSVAMTTEVHEKPIAHLLRSDCQEDLCFGIWRPSSGSARGTALLVEPILPADQERHVHGNVSFEGDYFLTGLRK